MTTRMANDQWRDKLRSFLIQGGTDGRSMRDITYYMQHGAAAEEILAELEVWRAEGKVDSYRVPTKGRPGVWWRANTNMLKELPKLEREALTVRPFNGKEVDGS